MSNFDVPQIHILFQILKSAFSSQIYGRFLTISNRRPMTNKRVRVMVFNATFNTISAISWWSDLLVEETGITWENHWPVVSHWPTDLPQVIDKLTCPKSSTNFKHNVVSSTPSLSQVWTLVVIGTICIGSYKSNHDCPDTVISYVITNKYSQIVKPVLRGHVWDKGKVAL